MTRIIYGKIGKTTSLDPSQWGAAGGDNEPLYLLLKLAERHPEVEWVFGTLYRKGTTDALPANVTVPELPQGGDAEAKYEEHCRILRPYYEDAAGVLMWLGPHGADNLPGKRQFSNPSKTYSLRPKDVEKNGPTFRMINEWRDVDPLAREEVWLCPDTRFPVKSKDLKWPLRNSVVSQYPHAKRRHRHDRYGDPRTPEECGFDARADRGTWLADHKYTVDGLEIVGLPVEWSPTIDFDSRVPFRVLTNETARNVGQPKAKLMREWLPGLTPGNLRGKWSQEGADELGIPVPEPCPFTEIPDFLGGAKTTFVTPTSGEGWPTLKMHEAFALGAICFFHPKADDKGSLIPTRRQIPTVEDPQLKSLAEWLRPPDPEALQKAVEAVVSDRATYEWLRDAQLAVTRRAQHDQQAVRTIEQRLGLPSR